jgi:hypothetical protein
MRSRRRRRGGARGDLASDDILRFLGAGPAVLRRQDAAEYQLAGAGGLRRVAASLLAALEIADLVARSGSEIALTDAGYARLARLTAAAEPFLAQHGGVSRTRGGVGDDSGVIRLVHDAESPLAWLARRKAKDGRPLIDAAQFVAGERLREDFTRAGLTPRVTANWIAPVAQDRRAVAAPAAFADAVVAAKARVERALAAVGTEFAGLLLDVCCFLKGLEIVERERGWPRSAARVVLAIALDRLAAHYGISAEARGPGKGRTRAWRAPDARPTMDGS